MEPYTPTPEQLEFAEYMRACYRTPVTASVVFAYQKQVQRTLPNWKYSLRGERSPQK